MQRKSMWLMPVSSDNGLELFGHAASLGCDSIHPDGSLEAGDPLLRRLVERHRQRLSVGDVDEITGLDRLEVLRILRLDGFRTALRAPDRDGMGLLVDRGDGRRDRYLPADGTRPRLARLRADASLLCAHTGRRGPRLPDLKSDRLHVGRHDRIAHIDRVELLLVPDLEGDG